MSYVSNDQSVVLVAFARIRSLYPPLSSRKMDCSYWASYSIVDCVLSECVCVCACMRACIVCVVRERIIMYRIQMTIKIRPKAVFELLYIIQKD